MTTRSREEDSQKEKEGRRKMREYSTAFRKTQERIAAEIFNSKEAQIMDDTVKYPAREACCENLLGDATVYAIKRALREERYTEATQLIYALASLYANHLDKM